MIGLMQNNVINMQPVEQSYGEFMTDADEDSDGMLENELWYK
jgi:hypothetical protein